VSPYEIAVPREQALPQVHLLVEAVAEGAHLLQPPVVGIPRDAADARVGGGEARARQELEEVVERLALGERVEEHRHGAHVHRVGAEPEQVARHPRELAADHADRVRARRRLDPAHALGGERDGTVVRQRREVVEPVGVGDEAVVAERLAQLLHAAVQVADVGNGLDHALAVHLEHDAQHPVRGRVLRAHVEHHPVAELAVALEPDRRLGSRRGRPAPTRPVGRCPDLAKAVGGAHQVLAREVLDVR
jgi:hypothetical protein